MSPICTFTYKDTLFSWTLSFSISDLTLEWSQIFQINEVTDYSKDTHNHGPQQIFVNKNNKNCKQIPESPLGLIMSSWPEDQPPEDMLILSWCPWPPWWPPCFSLLMAVLTLRLASSDLMRLQNSLSSSSVKDTGPLP